MHHHLGTVPLEQRAKAFAADVHVVEGEVLAVAPGLGEVGDPSGGEVVHGDDPMSLGQQAVRKMRADKPRTARYQDGGHADRERSTGTGWSSRRPGSAPTSSGVRSPRTSR